METFTRYLYEYRDGKRVKNTGFVKVEQGDRHARIKIYGNGIGRNGESAEVVLCELQGETCFGIPAGNLKVERTGIRGALTFTASDVGGEDAFRQIGGIVLKCKGSAGQPVCYAALWEDTSVAVEEMKIKKQDEKYGEPSQKDAVEEVEIEEKVEGPSQEDAVKEEEATEGPSQEDVVEEEVAENVSEGDVVEREEVAEEASEGDAVEREEAEETRQDTSEHIIYKITRKDMAALPKREWRLANNPFLLHGYYQYHHLVSFQQEGAFWLGVPGIYHPMEQRAADTYGFGQFMSPGEGEIVWEKEERAEDENFGYWCRQVSRVITKTEADRR